MNSEQIAQAITAIAKEEAEKAKDVPFLSVMALRSIRLAIRKAIAVSETHHPAAEQGEGT